MHSVRVARDAQEARLGPTRSNYVNGYGNDRGTNLRQNDQLKLRRNI